MRLCFLGLDSTQTKSNITLSVSANIFMENDVQCRQQPSLFIQLSEISNRTKILSELVTLRIKSLACPACYVVQNRAEPGCVIGSYLTAPAVSSVPLSTCVNFQAPAAARQPERWPRSRPLRCWTPEGTVQPEMTFAQNIPFLNQ